MKLFEVLRRMFTPPTVDGDRVCEECEDIFVPAGEGIREKGLGVFCSEECREKAWAWRLGV